MPQRQLHNAMDEAGAMHSSLDEFEESSRFHAQPRPPQALLRFCTHLRRSLSSQIERANLLETLENVVPQDLLVRIAPALTATSRRESLSSLRESAAARFQNGSVGSSDDEKPEPLSESPDSQGASSPRGARAMLVPNRGGSMLAGDEPSAALSSNGSAGKRHSMWAGDSPSRAASSTKRLSLSHNAGTGQSDSPSSVTVSPVAQRQVRPSSSSAVSDRASGSSEASKKSHVLAGDESSAALSSNGSKSRRQSMVRFS